MANGKQLNVDSATSDEDRWLAVVHRQVNSLQFGVVQIVVHNSRVTQIDRTERIRLDSPRVESLPNPPTSWK